MNKIYIVLSHTGTFVSKSIRFYMRSQYSHVSISFDKDLKNLYSFGRKTLRNPFNGGFIKEGINQGIYRKYRNTICTIYEVDVEKDKYDNARQLVDTFINNQEKLKYNYLGVFTIIFGFPHNRPNYYFCSQFVAEVLDKAGILTFNKEYSLIKPTDICNEDKFKLIYNGKLAYYTPYPPLYPTPTFNKVNNTQVLH